MHIHILGISGTFMAGLAVLAKQAGYHVSGSDQQVYPPMSTQLEEQGIALSHGYDSYHIPKTADYIVVGNVIKRGNPAMEYVLEQNIPYISGPDWLARHILQNRSVLAVSGTHGKTTTTSMLTWLLEYAGLQPGFLIGGVPENFGISASIGQNPFFVIEADEYDSAFFDKRAKFIHYHPKILILNNLEFDHADIFPNLSAIKQQFHYLVRTVPGNGRIIYHAEDIHLRDVLQQGAWTPLVSFGQSGGEWSAKLLTADGSSFEVMHEGISVGEVHWNLLGKHNVENALAALAAAAHAGVSASQGVQALASFKNVKRRLEIKGKVKDVTLYDDFAHHPTAIATTLAGLRANVGKEARIIVILEFGSYTMRSGVHQDAIPLALQEANRVLCKRPESQWELSPVLANFTQPTQLFDDVDSLVTHLIPELKAGDHIVVMSNSGFGGIHQKLLKAMAAFLT